MTEAKDHRQILVLFVLTATFVIVRATIYVFFGLLDSGDTSFYVEFADMILRDGVYPPFDQYSTRVPGYPLIVLMHKYLLGDNWRFGLYVQQSFMTLIAAGCVFHIAMKLTEQRWVALFAAASFSFSIQMFLDATVLPDSIYSSILLTAIWIALCLNRVSYLRYILAGIALALAFLIRESTLYLMLPIGALIAFVRWEQGAGSVGQTIRTMVSIALLMAPLFMLNTAIKIFHEKEYGIPAVTTGGKTVYWIALSTPYLSFFPEIFAGDDPVDSLYRQEIKDVSPWDVYAANQRVFILNDRLKSELGYSEYEISEIAKRKYLTVLKEHPLAIGLIVGFNIRPTTIFGVFQPFQNLLMLNALKTGDNRLWKTRFVFSEIVSGGDYKLIPIFLLLLFVRLLNVIVFGCFAALPLLVINVARHQKPEWSFVTQPKIIGLWLFYAGVWGIFALIHTEPRYLSAANVAVSIIGATVLVALYRKWRSRV